MECNWGLLHSLCAAVSLPEGSVFRLEWPETALVVYIYAVWKLAKAASRRVGSSGLEQYSVTFSFLATATADQL